jgi:hypothetical protein
MISRSGSTQVLYTDEHWWSHDQDLHRNRSLINTDDPSIGFYSGTLMILRSGSVSITYAEDPAIRIFMMIPRSGSETGPYTDGSTIRVCKGTDHILMIPRSGSISAHWLSHHQNMYWYTNDSGWVLENTLSPGGGGGGYIVWCHLWGKIGKEEKTVGKC